MAKKAKRFEGRGCLRASEAYIRDGGRCNKSAYRYLALFSAGGSKGLGSGVEKKGQKGQLRAITMRLRGREKLKWGERNKRNRVESRQRS